MTRRLDSGAEVFTIACRFGIDKRERPMSRMTMSDDGTATPANAPWWSTSRRKERKMRRRTRRPVYAIVIAAVALLVGSSTASAHDHETAPPRTIPAGGGTLSQPSTRTAEGTIAQVCQDQGFETTFSVSLYSTWSNVQSDRATLEQMRVRNWSSTDLYLESIDMPPGLYSNVSYHIPAGQTVEIIGELTPGVTEPGTWRMLFSAGNPSNNCVTDHIGTISLP